MHLVFLFVLFLVIAAGSGGSAEKFVRVVGSGRGSASRTPTRRAAVTTHTALDGSQAMNPWEGGSQLPDTDPDSGDVCRPPAAYGTPHFFNHCCF